MNLIVSGGALNNADPQGSYLIKRNPAVLQSVGALPADHAAIMDRADKIGLGNNNNISEAAEVDRLHQPEVHATLFPDEQRALGSLWDRFRVDTSSFPSPSIPEINAQSFTGVPASVGTIDPNRPFLISDLPQPNQQIARRIQLTINRDLAPPTIQYADILNAMLPENANKYTRPELEQIKELQQLFLNEILPRATTPPKVEVPELGEHRYPLAAEPGIAVDLITKSELTWSQQLSKHGRTRNVRPGGVTDVSDQLIFQRTPVAINFVVPPDHKMIVISSEGERVCEAGPAVLRPNPGQYIFELYDQQGQKVRDTGFTLPEASARQDLTNEHAGKPVIAGGRPMEAQLVSYATQQIANRTFGTRDFVNGYYHEAEWIFVPEGTASHNGDVAAAHASFTWPGGQLRDGTYTFVAPPTTTGRNVQIGAQTVTLEKYVGPAFSVDIEGQKFWLLPYGPSNYGDAALNGRQLFRGVAGNTEVTFEPETDTIAISRSGRQWTHVVEDKDFSEAQNIG